MMFDIPVLAYRPMAIELYVDGKRNEDMEKNLLKDLIVSGIVMHHNPERGVQRNEIRKM